MKKIVKEYTSSDSDQRELMHKKYGEKRIKAAIEEACSMDLIEKTSKQCPKCRSWLQKLDGCNKMTCTKCSCYFCWLCLQLVSRNDPYSHFNSINSECYQKLFEGTWNDNNNNNEPDDNVNNNIVEVLPELDGLDINENEFIYEEDDDDDGIIFAH